MKNQRRLWVLKGMLDHEVPEELLNKVSERNAKAGTVPTSYF
jgi:hypothetical protein